MVFRPGLIQNKGLSALIERAVRKHQQVTNQAAEEYILGDASGRIHPLVQNDAGESHLDSRYFLVRRDSSAQPEPVLWSGRGSFPVDPGTPLWVGYDYDGQKKILGLSTGGVVAQDYNPNVYNVLDMRAHGYISTESLPVLLCRAIGTASNPSTKILVAEELSVDESNTIRDFRGKVIDVAGDIPADDLHCLTSIFKKLDGTLVSIASTPKAAVVDISAADFQETVGNRPARSKLVGTYHLIGGSTTITEADKWWDTRQFLNEGAPRHNWFASTDPSVTDDADSGYGVGSFWCNNSTPEAFVCLDDTAGAAVWQSLSTGGGGAPSTAKYIVQTADGGLPNAQALSALASGDVQVTTTTGVLSSLKANRVATTNPGVSDDNTAGYSVGSRWLNLTLGREYVCLDTTTGAAVWKETTNTTAGTVTSVGLSMPAEFSVASSPVTSSGTLTVTKATQSANTVFAGTTTGAAAAPAFRALVDADIPSALAGHTITVGSINNTPIGATTQNTGYFSALRLYISSKYGAFTHANTGDQTYTLPDQTGTLALLSDLPRAEYLPRVTRYDNSHILISAGYTEIAQSQLLTQSAFTPGYLLDVTTNLNWISGASAEAASEFIWVYKSPNGAPLLHNKAPNLTAPIAVSATALTNQSGWNGGAGTGFNATSVVYDNDTGMSTVAANISSGIPYLAIFYASADSDYSLGRGRGASAGSSRNYVSTALVTGINTGTNTITLLAGHNIAINDNDRIRIVPLAPLTRRYEGSDYYTLIGALYNDASSNLTDTRTDKFAYYVANEASDFSTTSSSWADIDATRIGGIVLSTGAPIKFGLSGEVRSLTSAAFIDVAIDGVRYYGDDGIHEYGAAVFPIQIHRMIMMLPGTHTVTFQYRVAGGTFYLYAGAGTANFDTHPQFYMETQ